MVNNTPTGLITLLDYSSERVKNILDLAIETKKKFKASGPSDLLKGKTSVLIFEKPSLRTRVTFEVAMNQVGGSSINLDPHAISLGKRETVADAARNFSRWVDVIVARTFTQQLVEELSENSTVPVINALTDQFHPCQALAFCQTLMERRGNLKGLNLTFVGDGNNVANSLMIIAAQLGMNFTLSCPEGYEQNEDLIKKVQPIFSQNGGAYKLERDPHTAVSGSQVIYTDVWVSMGEESHKNEKSGQFKGYQVNADLVAKAEKDCLITHCLPAHRGEEITSEVMDSDNCICFDEAENRLHAQKAVLLSLLS